jgi:type II secretory pathway component GspD/PulD (secretin)
MKSSLLRLPALVSALLMAIGPQALAEVSALGTPEVAHVEVKNASLDEVLRALHDAYGLTYRSDIALDARISGSYEGPLSQVIARLLDGTNYVLTKNGNTFRIVIVAGAGSPAIPPVAAMPVPAPAAGTSSGGTSDGKAAPPFQIPGFFPPPGSPVPSARGN